MTEVSIKEAAASADESRKGRDISVWEAQVALVEDWLRKFNVRYSHVLPIPLSKIDREESRGTQTREKAIVPDLVERLSAKIRAGETVPPAVGYKMGDRVVLIDGNNRDEAHLRTEQASLPTFVLHPDTPGPVIELMRVDANAHHGVTPSVAWRMRQASHLVSIGWQIPQAADAANVSVTGLNNYLRAKKAEAKAARLKVKGFDPLGSMVKSKIGVMQSDAVFVALAKLVIEAGLGFEEVSSLVRELKTYATDEERLALIEVRSGRLSIEKNETNGHELRPGPNNARKNLLNALSRFARLDLDVVRSSFRSENERREMVQRLDEVSDQIEMLREALAPTESLSE
jgi:hypothetical protein